VVAARENGGKYGYAVGPNRELVALGAFETTFPPNDMLTISGAANLSASLCAVTGSVPIFGSLTRELDTAVLRVFS
jgi:hypothetical protein